MEATGVGGDKEDGRQEPGLGKPEPALDTIKQAKINNNQNLEVEDEQRHNESTDVEEDDDEDRELEAEEEGEEKKKEDSGKLFGWGDEDDDDEEDTDEDFPIAMASTARPSKAATRIHRIPPKVITPPLAIIRDTYIKPWELLVSSLHDICHKYTVELDANFETWLSDDASNLPDECFDWSDVSSGEDSGGHCWSVSAGEEEDVPDMGTTAQSGLAEEKIQSLIQQGKCADALRYCFNAIKKEHRSRRPGKRYSKHFNSDEYLYTKDLLKSMEAAAAGILLPKHFSNDFKVAASPHTKNLLKSLEAAAQVDADLSANPMKRKKQVLQNKP